MTVQRSFIGGWADPATANGLRLLAQLRGESQSEVLRGLVRAAMARASVAVEVEEDPGKVTGGGNGNRAGVILADSGAIAVK